MSKGCCVWSLASRRLRCSERAFQSVSAADVDKQFGKNAAYATIPLELLSAGAPADRDILWPSVQQCYGDATGKEPTGSEQGEVRLATILFEENQIRVASRSHVSPTLM